MLVHVSGLVVLVLLWCHPGGAQETQEIRETHETHETHNKAHEPGSETQDTQEPQAHIQETSHRQNDLHVVVICKENETEAERSFRQTACQMGYTSVMVVREKCMGGMCEFYTNLENQLKSLPMKNYAILADIRSTHAYLMASPDEALKQLKPWHDQLILAHPPYIPMNKKEGEKVESQKENNNAHVSSNEDGKTAAKEEDNEIKNNVETDETNKDKTGDKTKEKEHSNKEQLVHEEKQFQEEPNRLKRALNGGSAIGVVSSLLDALVGKEITNVFNDTIAQHIYFGDYIYGGTSIGIPVRVKFVPLGAQEEDATTPILCYSINDNTDFYNIIQVASEDNENHCSYQAPLEQNSIYPSLLVVMNMGEKWSPFMEEVFQGLLKQNFPKESTDIRIVNNFGVNEKEVSAFIFESTNLYRSIHVMDNLEENHLDLSDLCTSVSCDFVLIMSPRALLDNDDVINRLLETERLLVAPMLNVAHSGKDVNYVYTHNKEGSQWDQLIREKHVRSIVKVADIKDFVLAHKAVLDGKKASAPFLDTRQTVGFLVDPRGGHEGKLHQNLWGIRYNRNLWIRRYIQKDLLDIIKKKSKPQKLGHYLFYVPFFTERFCREMIEEMEHYGNWYDEDKDDREIGAHQYSSRNINLEDLGYKDEYMALLNSVHKELLSSLYHGFRSRAEPSLIFVLKYSSDKEYGTHKYHLDGATYTFNIALNNEFTGGGVQFKLGNPKFGKEEEFRVPHNRTGWAVIQPNRPLSYHRGVPLTTGVRYAMINIIESNCSGCKGGPLF